MRKNISRSFLCFLLLFFSLIFLRTPAFAGNSASSAGDAEKYSQEIAEKSGADDLADKLPAETRRILNELGVEKADGESVSSVTPQNYFQKILSVFSGKAKAPARVFAAAVSVILLCALLNSLKLSFGEKPLGDVVGLVGTLCICTVVVQPIVACVSDAAEMLKAASGFLLACAPVLAGIMAAAGQSASAGTYHLLTAAAGGAVSAFASTVLSPMMNLLLALSVVSSVSPGLGLDGLCGAMNKAVKWIMGLGMTLFTGLVTMHSVVAVSADNAGVRAAKFMVGSFVPVVGSALGEALGTVNGCVKALKSGVGAFGLLAGLFLFLPVLAECVLWVLTLTVCSGISRVFDLGPIAELLKSAADVVSTMTAILLCSMSVLIITTVAMLLIGGGA